MKNNEQHKYTPEQLGAYFDGQLTESERHEIEWHVKTCPRCQAFLADLTLMDKAVSRAENVSAPDGYFDTFGSAVANRIARQRLEPQKHSPKFSWGWVTAAAALASLAIVLISGDLTKPRLYRSVPEDQKTVLSEIPVDMKATDEAPSEKAGSGKSSLGANLGETPQKIKPGVAAPVEQAKSMAPSPELNLAEVPLEKEAPAAAPAKQDRSTEDSPMLDMAPAPAETKAKDEAPAKRAKEMTASRSSKPERSDDFIGAGLASAPAQAPTQAQAPAAEQVPAPSPVLAKAQTPPPALVPVRLKITAQPAVTSLEHRPASVENVTVIVICLPDGEKDCPEPKVTSAIRISLDGD